MKTPADQLRQLMTKKGLTRKRVAELAKRGKSTVDSWLAPPGASCHRSMHQRDYDLVFMNIEKQNGQEAVRRKQCKTNKHRAK